MPVFGTTNGFDIRMQLPIREQIDQLRRDRRRFSALYGTLRGRIYRLGGQYRPYASDSMLEDACSDAVMAVMVQYQGYFDVSQTDPTAFDDALTAYLFQAARNRLMSALQKDSRARSLFFSDGLESDDGTGKEIQPWLVDPSQSPDDELLAQQHNRLLHECLQRLSELARGTLQMALRGFNDQEIQEALKIASPGTVRRRVHDAKVRMIECVRGKIARGDQP